MTSCRVVNIYGLFGGGLLAPWLETKKSRKSWTPKMHAKICPETWTTMYQSTLRLFQGNLYLSHLRCDKSKRRRIFISSRCRENYPLLVPTQTSIVQYATISVGLLRRSGTVKHGAVRAGQHPLCFLDGSLPRG